MFIHSSGFHLHNYEKDLADQDTYRNCLRNWKNVDEETRNVACKMAELHNQRTKHLLKLRMSLSCFKIEQSSKMSFIQDRFLIKSLKYNGDINETITDLEDDFSKLTDEQSKLVKICSLMKGIKERTVRLLTPYDEILEDIVEDNINKVVESYAHSLDNRLTMMGYIQSNPEMSYAQLVLSWLQMERWERILWTSSRKIERPLWYPCLQKNCREVFSTKSELIEHLQQHIMTKCFIADDQSKPYFKCEWKSTECMPCISGFLSKEQLKYHWKNFHVATLVGRESRYDNVDVVAKTDPINQEVHGKRTQQQRNKLNLNNVTLIF